MLFSPWMTCWRRHISSTRKRFSASGMAAQRRRGRKWSCGACALRRPSVRRPHHRSPGQHDLRDLAHAHLALALEVLLRRPSELLDVRRPPTHWLPRRCSSVSDHHVDVQGELRHHRAVIGREREIGAPERPCSHHLLRHHHIARHESMAARTPRPKSCPAQVVLAAGVAVEVKSDSFPHQSS